MLNGLVVAILTNRANLPQLDRQNRYFEVAGCVWKVEAKEWMERMAKKTDLPLKPSAQFAHWKQNNQMPS